MSFRNVADFFGAFILRMSERLGFISKFFIESLFALRANGVRVSRVTEQMYSVGVASLAVVALIGVTGGAVLALQSYIGLHRFGAERFIGPVIFLSMTRELGPVFTAIMVIGRAGSAMTAEIGTMRITEQIDALTTLSIDPYCYLVVPRIIASTLILPAISIWCSVCGILSGYVVAVWMLNINSEVYMETIRMNAVLSDITSGLIKASFFGFLLSLICTYKGFITEGGAKGVGKSTTQSVVFSNVTIFVANYILTSLMF